MASPISRRALAAAATAILLGLSGCSSGGQSASVTPPPASGTGTLRIGVATDEPGVSLKEGASYSGFDIETATYVAAALDVPAQNITWVPIEKADRESALESGEVNLVVDTFTITPERQQRVDFAGPYFVAHQDLLIRRNDVSITGPESLDGKILCSVTGTTSAAYVRDNYRGRITLREVPTYSECVRNLAAGDVDAVSTDDLILAGFAAQPDYKGVLKVVGNGFTDERYGIGVRKGDTATVQKVNDALTQYIDSGAWRAALDKTVAPSGYAIPDPPTVGN